jgi:hypothetical protein
MHPLRYRSAPSIHCIADPTNGIVNAGRAGAAALLLTVLAHLAFVVKIALVPDEQYRDIALVLGPKDLLMESVGFLERFPGCYRVHQEESFSNTQVLFHQGST